MTTSAISSSSLGGAVVVVVVAVVLVAAVEEVGRSTSVVEGPATATPATSQRRDQRGRGRQDMTNGTDRRHPLARPTRRDATLPVRAGRAATPATGRADGRI